MNVFKDTAIFCTIGVAGIAGVLSMTNAYQFRSEGDDLEQVKIAIEDTNTKVQECLQVNRVTEDGRFEHEQRLREQEFVDRTRGITYGQLKYLGPMIQEGVQRQTQQDNYVHVQNLQSIADQCREAYKCPRHSIRLSGHFDCDFAHE